MGEITWREARARAIADFERTYIAGLLIRCDGNVSKAARAADIDRVYLYRLMRTHGIKTQENPLSADERIAQLEDELCRLKAGTCGPYLEGKT